MHDAPVLSGELGLLSLFDLGQLFLLNGTTGELAVERNGRRGYFYFDRGQIVNAVDDEYHEGEGAAYRLFTWREGSFEFRAKRGSSSRAITEGTEGLMMEAARRMDEAGESGGHATERLQRRADALEALREAFQSVARESGSVAQADHEAGGSPFALLRDPGDALLFRPNHVPRVRHQDRWRDAGTTPLDGAAFDQLRTRLLDGTTSAATPARGAAAASAVITYEDGRRYVVTRIGTPHEALWVRAAEVSAGETLDGPLPELHALLRWPAGLLLLGASDAETADHLLHAALAQLTPLRAATVLLAGDHGRWHHGDGGGALVRGSGTELPGLLRTFAPDVVALDTAHADTSLDALQSAPLVIAAVVAPEAGALIARWCARVGRRWGDGIETLLATAPLGVAFARRTGTPGILEFAAAPLSFGAAAPAIATEPDAPIDSAKPAATNTHAPAADAPPMPAPDAALAAPADPMTALAAELSRTLRKAA